MSSSMNPGSIGDLKKKLNKMRILIPKNKANNPPAMAKEKYSEKARSFFETVFNKKKMLPTPKNKINRILKTISHSFIRTSQLSRRIFTKSKSMGWDKMMDWGKTMGWDKTSDLGKRGSWFPR